VSFEATGFFSESSLQRLLLPSMFVFASAYKQFLLVESPLNIKGKLYGLLSMMSAHSPCLLSVKRRELKRQPESIL
jgi:hypothetical protein